MKIGKLFAAACTLLILLSGCQKKEEEPWVPDSTAIQVSQDGRITETIIDRLTESYYSSTELQEMVNASVKDHTAVYGDGSVFVKEFTANGSDIRIVLEYAAAEDYAAFNNVRFYNGSMLGAQMEGYRFETSFQLVAKDGTVSEQKVPADGPVSHKEYQVLVTDRSHKVEVPGNIVYVSAPSQVEDRRIVTPLTAAEDTDQSAVSEQEAGLLYILYEYH